MIASRLKVKSKMGDVEGPPGGFTKQGDRQVSGKSEGQGAGQRRQSRGGERGGQRGRGRDSGQRGPAAYQQSGPILEAPQSSASPAKAAPSSREQGVVVTIKDYTYGFIRYAFLPAL